MLSFPPVFVYSLALCSCYPLERVCPLGLRSFRSPFAYSYVANRCNVSWSILAAASPFALETLSHCHEFCGCTHKIGRMYKDGEVPTRVLWCRGTNWTGCVLCVLVKEIRHHKSCVLCCCIPNTIQPITARPVWWRVTLDVLSTHCGVIEDSIRLSAGKVIDVSKHRFALIFRILVICLPADTA